MPEDDFAHVLEQYTASRYGGAGPYVVPPEHVDRIAQMELAKFMRVTEQLGQGAADALNRVVAERLHANLTSPLEVLGQLHAEALLDQAFHDGPGAPLPPDAWAAKVKAYESVGVVTLDMDELEAEAAAFAARILDGHRSPLHDHIVRLARAAGHDDEAVEQLTRVLDRSAHEASADVLEGLARGLGVVRMSSANLEAALTPPAGPNRKQRRAQAARERRRG